MWHEVILPRKKSYHLLYTAEDRRLGLNLLHRPNRFGRLEANQVKNSCGLNKARQRHRVSVLTLILISFYVL